MDTTARWSEGIGVVNSMEEKKAVRVQKPQALNCPRCNSSHTKFCYYNNYNLSQPRYFCKTCRRYWTAGGSLRNVPVGGASRRNKRPSSSSSPKTNHHDHMMMPLHSSSNLNSNQHIIPNSNTHGDQDHLMGFFKSGSQDYARGMMMMNSFMPSTDMMMNTCVDGFNNNGDDNNGIKRAVSTTATATAPSTSARLFFPLEHLKPTLASTTDNQVQGDSTSNAYGVEWNHDKYYI